MTRLWLQPVFVLVKFYSAIENVDGISTRESEFYPQDVDIPTKDRASQAVVPKIKRLWIDAVESNGIEHYALKWLWLFPDRRYRVGKVEAVFKGALYLVFIGLILGAAYLAVTDGKGAYLFMGLAVLVIVGARLTDIVKLRFGSNGIEAEMERIRESLNELHVLSELFAKFSLTQMQGAGRWGGYNSSERARMRAMIVDGLRSIGVAERRIQKALEVEWPFMKFDYYYAATQAADRQRDRPSTENAFRAFFEARPQGIGNEPSPAELRVLFDQVGITGGEANEAWLDYFHFVETHTHRRSPI